MLTISWCRSMGKDKADPQDELSRHPLPETRDDSTEHAVVITRIREETLKEEVIPKLVKRIVKGDWRSTSETKTWNQTST